MSENTDDLEQTLVLAAAAADSRQYDNDEVPDYNNANEEIRYYTEAESVECSKSASPKANLVDTISSPPSEPHILNEPTNHLKSKSEQDFQGSTGRRGIKRSIVEPNESEYSDSRESSHSQVVATHYNRIEEKGLDERSRSRIVHLRNFHNWIKSMLINEYLLKIGSSKKQHNPPIRVLDLCCGKGGDLSKWRKGNVSHLICSDIAEVSLEHCKSRYADMKQRAQTNRGRGMGNLFSMEIVHGDMCKSRLREKYSDPSIKLDLVSCQFAAHYGFESLPQAEVMMKNASECLQPGGYFIGTMTDANEIVARSRKSVDGSFGNNLLQVSPEFDLDKPPLFGGKYNFELDEVVKCPEFLVHFPTFVKLAKKYGLKLVKMEKFHDFFERMKEEGKQLLSNMGALESYPPHKSARLVGDEPDDYLHAKEFIDKCDRYQVKIGTLSKSEWEASSLYLTFAFEKVKNTWNTDGTPCYDI